MRHYFIIFFSLLWSAVSWAETLGDLVDIQGVRGNQLVGYSLVVGLDGSGDKNQVKFTSQSVTNMLRQFGVQMPAKIDPKVKNVAAVAISATLPPGYARGQTIDVTVSSIGDAKSLRGGTLLLTQLRGADGEVYALAQGNVVVGGIKAEGNSGSSVTINTPTVGRVPNGASIEREIPSDFQENDQVTLNLKRPSFKTANNIAVALNNAFGANTATAQNSTNVVVKAPQGAGARVAFMSMLEDVQINVGKQRPRVVFNARTGTVVIGEGVVVRSAAVSHGNLTVTINESTNVSQPPAFSRGQTVATPESSVSVNRGRGQMVTVPTGTNLRSIVSTINSLGAAPDDTMAILQALHEAGALDAELVVI
ncbi:MULTISPECIES: flagellar basal body P-ring protein FlgI [unclassified Serratia (in: enterobacteria)]|uniref:flagellar basal body P-ring protein FlgI n=1 Tax=unclassified Serratia (in: enterobacteria) TaxID=2647522 RepID=UPI000508955E|nr:MULTISPECIES: flagellar basal body P-ring protein FlgI [unclassified Serratia (in: enterobacteria)]KFK95344.1 flagellar P-ring protein FlgI [Serratia sp. Ag2]KFK98692.1 flagellar P-ring protein FlgI [Serratia sp. Ag1]